MEGGCCMIINFNKHSEHWAGQRSSSVLPSLNSSHTFCGFSVAVVVEEQWLFSCLKLSVLQLGVLLFRLHLGPSHTEKACVVCMPTEKDMGPCSISLYPAPLKQNLPLCSQKDPVTPLFPTNSGCVRGTHIAMQAFYVYARIWTQVFMLAPVPLPP